MFQDDQSQQNQSAQQPAAPTTPSPQSQQQNQQQAEQKPQQQPQQKPTPVKKPEKTTQEERMWSAIGYVAFLGVVTLAIKPKSEFCKHHAAQGLTIFAVWFVSLILFAMPSIIGVLGGLLLLGATVLAVLGIIKAIQSYTFELPVLSAVAKKIPTDSIIGSVTGKTPEAKKPTEGQAQQEQAPQSTQKDEQQTPPPTPPQNQESEKSNDNSGQNQQPPQK